MAAQENRKDLGQEMSAAVRLPKQPVRQRFRMQRRMRWESLRASVPR